MNAPCTRDGFGMIDTELQGGLEPPALNTQLDDSLSISDNLRSFGDFESDGILGFDSLSETNLGKDETIALNSASTNMFINSFGNWDNTSSRDLDKGNSFETLMTGMESDNRVSFNMDLLNMSDGEKVMAENGSLHHQVGSGNVLESLNKFISLDSKGTKLINESKKLPTQGLKMKMPQEEVLGIETSLSHYLVLSKIV